MAIIYRTFTGTTYKTRKEYEDKMDILLNKNINEFNESELNNYIEEYFPNDFNIYVNPVNSDHLHYYNVTIIRISTMSHDDEKFIFEISSFYDNNKGVESSYVSLKARYKIPSETLLKDLFDVFKTILKKCMNNWEKYEIKYILNKDINTLRLLKQHKHRLKKDE